MSESPTPAATLRSARLSLGLLVAINMLNYIDRYILAAVEPRVRDHFFPDHASNPESTAKFWMGMLAPAFLVSYMVIAPVFGWLGDRFNRWVLIGVGVIVWSLASGASGLATTFGMLVATRVFVGIGEAAYGPTAPTIIADMYPVERRGAVLAWFYVAIPVGSALGYVLGGQVASWADDWRWPFYVVVPVGMALGTWCFFRREPPRGQADNAALTRRVRRADYLTLLRTRSYVFNVAGMTAMTFAIGGISFWMPTYLIEFRNAGDEASVNRNFGAVVVLAGLGATIFGGWLGDRLRTKYPGSYFLVSAAGMLLGFPLFYLVLHTPFPLAWVFLFLAVFCLFLNTGPSNTIIANVTHPALRSSAYAVSILMIHLLGDAISPPIIGYITDHTKDAAHPRGNMNAAFMTVSAAILFSGVLWALGAKFLKEDSQRAPTRLSP